MIVMIPFMSVLFGQPLTSSTAFLELKINNKPLLVGVLLPDFFGSHAMGTSAITLLTLYTSKDAQILAGDI
ncbi:hypothetical protein Cylst_3248 [Cylindrospermum stagnale PCC 7417]|uniref:Uncharacterized protein n=1 Tax=Cylindrospermum stagnale PCC 7417 TaxID=56107 RepID=K9X028_9NOST|nr:hypothetical protein Cylst_3248 [Cylindrospermum stagnale PCC 7417]